MRGLVIVSHRTQCSARGSFLEKHRQQSHQQSGDQSSDQIFLVDQQAALENILKCHDGVFGHADVDLVNVIAKNRLAKTFQEISNAQGGHQQGGAFLVNQSAQDQSLNQPCHDEHHATRQHKGDEVDQHRISQACGLRQPFGKPRHGQGRKQHHRTLSEIEHTRGFVNEHKAQSNQRIQHARHQAAQQSFKKECHGVNAPYLNRR